MSGFFTWGRIAAIAGVGVAAAGVAYLIKTERGRALVQQAREKGLQALANARQRGAISVRHGRRKKMWRKRW